MNQRQTFKLDQAAAILHSLIETIKDDGIQCDLHLALNHIRAAQERAENGK